MDRKKTNNGRISKILNQRFGKSKKEENLKNKINELSKQIELLINSGEKITYGQLIRISLLRTSLDFAIRREQIRKSAKNVNQSAMDTLRGKINYSQDMDIINEGIYYNELYDPESKKFIYRDELKSFANLEEFLEVLKENGGEEIANRINETVDEKRKRQSAESDLKSYSETRVKARKDTGKVSTIVNKTEKSLVRRKDNVFTRIFQFFTNFSSANKNSKAYQEKRKTIIQDADNRMLQNNGSGIQIDDIDFEHMDDPNVLDAIMNAAYKRKKELVGEAAETKLHEASKNFRDSLVPDATNSESDVYDKVFENKLAKKGIEPRE